MHMAVGNGIHVERLPTLDALRKWTARNFITGQPATCAMVKWAINDHKMPTIPSGFTAALSSKHSYTVHSDSA